MIDGSLADFDMVFAVTLDTVNRQLRALHESGQLPHRWTIDIESSTLDIAIGSPTLRPLSTGQSQRQVEAHFLITDGNFTYTQITIQHGAPVVTQYPIDMAGSELMLLANLSRAELASTLDHLPDNIRTQLSAFDRQLFNIQQVFLDLQNVYALGQPRLTAGALAENTDPQIEEQFQNVLRSLLASMTNPQDPAQNPYLLGYAVQDRSTQQSSGPFAPVDMSYSVYLDGQRPDRSSLNYLFVTGSRAAPGGAAGIFSRNLVAENAEASFVISRALMSKLIREQALPTLAAAIGGSAGGFREERGMYSMQIANSMDGSSSCRVAPVPGTNWVNADFFVTFDRTVRDRAGSEIGHTVGSIAWTTTLQFGVAGGGLSITAFNSQPVQQSENHLNALGEFERGLAIFGDVVAGLFNGFQPIFQNLSAGDWQTRINVSFSQAAANLRTRVILPGGGDWSFRQPYFDADGNLTLPMIPQAFGAQHLNQPCFIRTRLNGYVLDIDPSANPPRAVVNPPDPATPRQRWILTPDGYLQNCQTGLVLDIFYSQTAPATPIIAYSRNLPPTPNQRWSIDADGYITSMMHGMVIDVTGSQMSPGTPIIAYPRNVPRSANQQWDLVAT